MNNRSGHRRGKPDTKKIAGVEVLLNGRELNKSKQMGGKGTTRRKIKRIRNEGAGTGKPNAPVIDPKLNAFYTSSGLTFGEVNDVEEVNMFRADGTFIQIRRPTVEASVTANTFLVAGRPSEKKVKDHVTKILDQLSMEAFAAPKEEQSKGKKKQQTQQSQPEKTVEKEQQQQEVLPVVTSSDFYFTATTSTPFFYA